MKYIYLTYENINVKMNEEQCKYFKQGKCWMRFVLDAQTCVVGAAHGDKVGAGCASLHRVYYSPCNRTIKSI